MGYSWEAEIKVKVDGIEYHFTEKDIKTIIIKGSDINLVNK